MPRPTTIVVKPRRVTTLPVRGYDYCGRVYCVHCARVEGLPAKGAIPLANCGDHCPRCGLAINPDPPRGKAENHVEWES